MSSAVPPDLTAIAVEPASPARLRSWLTLAVVGLLLVGFAMFLRGLERPAEWVMQVDEIAHTDGLAWIVKVQDRVGWPWQALGGDQYDPFRSDLQLFEDGRRLGPHRAALEVIATSGGGAYTHWGKRLWFSTSDDSDPRSNGRAYRVTFTAQVAPTLLRRLADAGSLLVAFGLVGALWVHRRVIASRLFERARTLSRRLPEVLLAAAIPTALASVAWAYLPPLWNGSDSVIWLLWQLPWIPHHAPLYPLMMSFLAGVTGDNPAAMLQGAMLIQQSLQVVAVAWVAAAFRGPGRILLVSAAASLGTSYGLFSHGLFTEGLANPLLLLFLGALLRLWRDGPTLRVMVVLALTLLLASLSRYVLIVLAGMPVLFLLLAALLRHRLRTGWRAVGLAVVLAVGIVGANSAINAWLSVLLNAQSAPVLGRAAVYRIQETYRLVPPDERAVWLAALQARTDDPQVRAALPMMAKVENPWTGPRDALAETQALYGRHPDVLMAAGFHAFWLWPNAWVWNQWAQEFSRAALGPEPWGSPAGQVRRLLQESAASIEAVFPRDPRAVAAVTATGTGADDPATAARYRALAEQTWGRLADLALPISPPHRIVLLGLSLTLLMAALWRGHDPGLRSLALTLWGGALAYLVALTLITVVLPRYLAPVDLLLWLANALSVLALTTGRATARNGA